MSAHRSDIRPPSAWSTLRQRCSAIGLPTWRCDAGGIITEEPTQGDQAGMWLRCPAVTHLVTLAAQAWRQESTPVVREAFPGCWLIPLEERRRRDRVGYTVALALSKRALQDEWFDAACASAQLDAQAARTALAPFAHHDAQTVTQAQASLSWMFDDLAKRFEDEETISGFTRQLTDGFETIDLLYNLGRSMSDLANPQAFLRAACDRLAGSMSFAWIAAWFGADERIARVMPAQITLSGRSAMATETISRALQTAATTLRADPRAIVTTEFLGEPLPEGRQALLHPVMRGGRLVGILAAGEKFGDDLQVSSYDIHLLEAAGGYIGAFLENAALYADQRGMFLGTLGALTSSIDAKDRYTCGHSERVALLSKRIAEAMGLPAATAERLHICGLVHDVGKIGVPEAVLTKPGRLTNEEFEAIKLHPDIGHRILKDISLLEDILPGVLHHHERWDGKGYPSLLAGEAIPLYARIIALADTFDAMSSNRSYRPAAPREKVLAEVARCAGTQFDPALVPVMLKLDFAEYDRMVQQHAKALAAATPGVAPEAPRAAA